MQRKHYLITCLILCVMPLLGQDVIVKIDGDSLAAHVLAIESENVVYQLPDAQEEQRLNKSDIARITYASGMRQSFVVSAGNRESIVISTSDEGYRQGQRDARVQYREIGPMSAALYPSVIFPPAGLVVAIVVGATPPQVDLGDISDPALFRDPQYAEGYNRKSAGKKRGAAAKGFLFGTLIFFVWVAALGG